MLLAGAICGFCYAIFAGQPLTIIGATGPLLVFESIVCYLCEYVSLVFFNIAPQILKQISEVSLYAGRFSCFAKYTYIIIIVKKLSLR